jgi:hypothetical protein
LVHTSSVIQLASASRDNSLHGLWWSWCPLTQLTFKAIERLHISCWIPCNRS